MARVRLQVASVTREEVKDLIDYEGYKVEIQSSVGIYQFRFSRDGIKNWSRWTSCHGHPTLVNQGNGIPPAAKIAIEFGIPAQWVSWQRHWEANIKKKK